jgi:anaerobic ribonucleoside-triphosphate reductase activating protein
MKQPLALRVHHVEPASLSNGPGWRTVVWLQGCTLNCEGCFNPETHSSAAGEVIPVLNLFNMVFSYQSNLEGITISGGEPLQQLPALIAFLSAVRRETSLSVLLFSGYDWQEIQSMPKAGLLVSLVDVLIAGRYIFSQRLAQGLIGSGNKTTHLLSRRYSLADLAAVPEAEVILNQNGEIVFSGINPIHWG